MTRGIAVGLVGPLPPPSGGMANQTRQLARLLSESGLSVTLIQVNPAYRPAWVEHLPIVRAIFRLAPYIVSLWRAAPKVDLFHVMANSGWGWHLFAAPAIWIAHLRGKPVIVNYRGGGAERFFDHQFPWVKPALRRASVVVVPSEFLKTVFDKWHIETSVVPNVIDLSRFQPRARPGQDIHIVVARNLEPLYDIATAMRAFAAISRHYPNARLSVAGSGSARAELERLRAHLGLEAAIAFTGRLDNEQMAGLYQTADLMLNPSLADNMPISLLEAMASGVPVVSTNVGGIPYLVRDGVTALLVPPQDPQAMADAALRILSSPVLAEELRAAGIAEVQQYSWDRVRDRLFEVYAGVLRTKGLTLSANKAEL
jgi:glycosyltransferase involved in cell wall biosynthesis